MYAKQLKSAFGKGLLKTTEAEVAITPTPSKRQFDRFVAGMGATTHTVMLDVSYSVAKENMSYRVTIRNEDDIRAVMNEASRPKADVLAIYKRLCADGRHTLIKKKKDKGRTKELDDKLLLRVSSEIPVTPEDRTMLQELTKVKAKSKSISFRLKDRRTHTVVGSASSSTSTSSASASASGTTSGGTGAAKESFDGLGLVLKIDATHVKALYDGKEAESYEVEVEVTATQDVSAVPAAFMELFGETISRTKEAVLARGSSSRSSASTTTTSSELSAREGHEGHEGRDVTRRPPKKWMLPDRRGFADWMHNTFKYSRNDRESDAHALFPHQKLARDFLYFQSPYRGILLYHGLGVGKTLSSIAAAEGFVNNGKRVIVMIPASLENNYREEILKHAMTHHHAQEPPRTREALVAELDKKYTFLRYNGITKDQYEKMGPNFFDDAFIVIDEAHNFVSRVVNGGNSSIPKRIYNSIMNASKCKLVLLTGSPVINHPYELSVLLNLARGPMHTTRVSFTPSVAVTQESIDAHLAKSPYVDQCILIDDSKTQSLEFTLLPQGFVNSSNGMVRHKAWRHSVADTIDKVTESIKEMLDEAKVRGRISVKSGEAYAFPAKKDDFVREFIDMSDRENPRVINMDLFTRRALGLVSYFKNADAKLFPTVLPRVIEEAPMSDTQFNTYIQARDKERSMERAGRGVLDAESSVYRAYSRMACNFVFPKEIVREFPSDVRTLMKREIQVVDEDEERAAEAGAAAGAGAAADGPATATVKEKDVARRYDQSLDAAMKAIKAGALNYLSRDALRFNYSSKFAAVLENIDTCPGKALLYSQFRVVEGLGLLALILKAHGYAEVKVEKSPTGWLIADAQTVLSPEYHNKRFIVFDEDRDKTKLLLQLYNGLHDLLPDSIKAQLAQSHVKTVAKNVRGEFIKLLMITQSGAEGISLKNVRRVLITEPFWNMVRMDQVVGRAVRTGSHLELPPGERFVEVFIYTATLTPKQLSDNFTLRRKDNSMTSDSHILMKAVRKDELIQEFMNALKVGSIDCRNNAAENRLTDNGLACYAFPIPVDPNEYAYTSSFEYDKTQGDAGRHVRHRRIRGYVVSLRGQKYVKIHGDSSATTAAATKLYDYTAYKNAGVLVEVLPA